MVVTVLLIEVSDLHPKPPMLPIPDDEYIWLVIKFDLSRWQCIVLAERIEIVLLDFLVLGELH
ncbi:hypothetical protein D3C78_1717450 [compost metagenome]